MHPTTSIRRLTLTSLVSLCALAGGLLYNAPAQASIQHEYLSRITEVPAASGAAVPGGLSSVAGMTVDNGDLWISERIQGTETSRVDEFTEAGDFLTQLNEADGLQGFRHGVAVGHGTPEAQVYVGARKEIGGEPEGVVGVYATSGTLLGVWTGTDTPNDSFGGEGVQGVAVDSSKAAGDWASGDVLVADSDFKAVDVFKPESGGGEKYITQITGIGSGEPFSGPTEVAVDDLNGYVFVVDGTSVVDELKPAGMDGYELVRQIAGTSPTGASPGTSPQLPFSKIRGLAVDSTDGDLYVAEEASDVVDELDLEGVLVGRLTGTPAGAFAELASVAFSPTSGRVYVGDARADGSGSEAGAIDVFGPGVTVPDVAVTGTSSPTPEGATLEGTVNPEDAGAATCEFEYGTTTAYGQHAACSEPVADGNAPVPVHASVSGLSPDTTYHYRLTAINAGELRNTGEGPEDLGEFTTPGPGHSGESVAEVSANSAIFEAQVDPHGEPTYYYFEYGETASYGKFVPSLGEPDPHGQALGSGESQPVAGTVQELTANKFYHYRIVVTSEPSPGVFEMFEGPDRTFTTQSLAAGFALPDGRGWELVSPAEMHGAGLEALDHEQGADIQVAEDGGKITYVATAPIEANPAGSRSLETTQVLSTREGAGAWASQDIATTHSEGAGPFPVSELSEYRLFSNDLSHGLLQPAGDTPLVAEKDGSEPEKTDYFHEADGEYKALVNAENVPSGIKLDGEFQSGVGYDGAVKFAGASPDLSHVAFHSPVGLSAGSASTGEGHESLFEWEAGQLSLVSVLPGAGGQVPGELGDANEVVRNAISEDGSRVVWEGRPHLYLRDMPREETARIDAAQAGITAKENRSIFRTASTDDRRIFFTSRERLTSDSAANGTGPEDLYVYEITSRADEALAGHLTDLSAAPKQAAGVLGVIGAAADGSDVYFVASAVLGDGAEHGAVSGGDNLYLERYEKGTEAWGAPVFIAALAAADAPSWGAEPSRTSGLAKMTSRVSPNGEWLAFMSQESLTGYDNQDAKRKAHNEKVYDEEVFLYDAGAGRLICASCDPSGARPVGVFESGGFPGPLVDHARNWGGATLAGNIPGWTTSSQKVSYYQSRYLSNEGRLFFDSASALVPADVNGKEDVYEYEPEGLGSCQNSTSATSTSTVFSEAADGCVGLISSGQSSEESAFMDATENGSEVFFLTSEKLSPEAYESGFALYDAHECTAALPCPPAAAQAVEPCDNGDACKPAATPQPALFGEPSSETFAGAGNVIKAPAAVKAKAKPLTRAQKLTKALKTCRKDKQKGKRTKCEAKARKDYAPVKKKAKAKGKK